MNKVPKFSNLRLTVFFYPFRPFPSDNKIGFESIRSREGLLGPLGRRTKKFFFSGRTTKWYK